MEIGLGAGEIVKHLDKEGFDYCGVDPYTVNMRGEGDVTLCVKAKDGGQKLDGGNSTVDGVAANEHDYTFSWSF